MQDMNQIMLTVHQLKHDITDLILKANNNDLLNEKLNILSFIVQCVDSDNRQDHSIWYNELDLFLEEMLEKVGNWEDYESEDPKLNYNHPEFVSPFIPYCSMLGLSDTLFKD